MIKGLHVTLFTPEADALRAFLRDTLGLQYSDAGGGWLIFGVANAELACHPVDPEELKPGQRSGESYQEMSFYCDDIEKTVAELRKRGVEFTSEINDEGYGFTAYFKMPGFEEVMLYQPKYARS